MISIVAQMELGIVPYAVLVAYLLVLLGLGWLGYLRSRASEEDYYLAGQSGKNGKARVLLNSLSASLVSMPPFSSSRHAVSSPPAIGALCHRGRLWAPPPVRAQGSGGLPPCSAISILRPPLGGLGTRGSPPVQARLKTCGAARDH